VREWNLASSLENKGNAWEQLQALKVLTFETGVVHQAQLDQLRLWGRVAFQFVPKEGFECQVDTDHQDVHYVLNGGKLFKEPSWFSFKKKEFDFDWLVGIIAGLDRSIHDLLGPEWRLLVTHNGKLEYEGGREKTIEEMKHERREYQKERNRTGR
jgi:hypothetical protein